METLLEMELYPSITQPTRITKSSATLIDNILLSKSLYSKCNSGVLIKDTSDHLPCLSVIKGLSKGKPQKKLVIKRDMKGCNIESLKYSLGMVDWNSELKNWNANDQFTTFHDILLTNLDAYCPVKTSYIPDKFVLKEPWITKGLLTCIRHQKKNLYYDFLKGRTDVSETKYKTYRRHLQKIL